MILCSRPTIRDVLFATRGSILPAVIRPLAFMVCASLAAVVLFRIYPSSIIGLASVPFTLIGLSLSIFMSFRNTSCYGRWWEARQLWGQLIIASRSFARQLAGLPVATRAPALEAICAFSCGLAARLRGEDEIPVMLPYLSTGEWCEAPNPTNAALTIVGMYCHELVATGEIDAIHYSLLETQLSEMAHVQGGCERIKNTPLPFSYSLLLHRTAYAFCLLLPFALAPSLGWWTPLPTILVSYAFFGLDALGDELSDPFGTDPNDLPLASLTRTIERDLLHAAGYRDLPPALLAKDDLLL